MHTPAPILVTGGSGHTGRRLAAALASRGDAVRILTRQPAIIPLELRRRTEIWRASLHDPAAAREAVRGCRAIIALTHIKLAPAIIEAARAEGVTRAIFMSSTRRFTKFPEETARHVIAGEQAVEASSLDWTIIRPSMIYGGKQDRNLQPLLDALRRWPVFPLPGGGRMLWQPVFTGDVVAALLSALDRPASIGRAYTIAGPEPISYRDMLRTMLREAGLRRLLIPIPLSAAASAVRLYQKMSQRPAITLDQIQRLREDKTFDISDARRDLDFAPISFEEGIRRKIAGTA